MNNQLKKVDLSADEQTLLVYALDEYSRNADLRTEVYEISEKWHKALCAKFKNTHGILDENEYSMQIELNEFEIRTFLFALNNISHQWDESNRVIFEAILNFIRKFSSIIEH